jgi:hypothetical protein
MPLSHWGAETRDDRGANLAELEELHQRLDPLIGRVLDEFMEANELTGQYTVGTSDHPPAWWLGNAHTATAARPLQIHLQFDTIDRSTEPTVSVQVQGAAERFPPNVHTLAHVLHRETRQRVRVQGSQGKTDVWPQPQENSQASHGPHPARATDLGGSIETRPPRRPPASASRLRPATDPVRCTMAPPPPPTRWAGPVEILAAAGDVAGTSHARFWRRDDSPLGTAWGGIIAALPTAIPSLSAEPVAVRLLASGRTGTIKPLVPPSTPSTGAEPRGNAHRVEGLGAPPF